MEQFVAMVTTDVMGPVVKKTCLRDFRTGHTQTSQLSYCCMRGGCVWSVFLHAVVSVLSSLKLAIISLRKGELDVLLQLCICGIIAIVWLSVSCVSS